MTGFVALLPAAARSALVRTVIEVTVLAVGWLLGGTVGVGTVLYALAIGPLAHVFIPLFTVPTGRRARPHDGADRRRASRRRRRRPRRASAHRVARFRAARP